MLNKTFINMTDTDKRDIFEDVFNETQDELGLAWWELFDGEDFEIVVERIADALGMTVEELEDDDAFRAWVDEMADEL